MSWLLYLQVDVATALYLQVDVATALYLQVDVATDLYLQVDDWLLIILLGHHMYTSINDLYWVNMNIYI